jgi:hypothetical protein
MARKLSPNAESFVTRVESMLLKAGNEGGLARLACRMLTGEDTKVAAFIWAKLMSYKYGTPKQTLEVKGEVSHTLTSEERQQAQQTIQKLLTGSKDTIEVESKEVVN